MDLGTVGKYIVVIGLGLALVGGLLWLAGRTGLPIGRLPGDINIERGSVRVMIPCATSILLSLLLTVGLNLLLRLINR
jgi:hypothetical protein